jgi:hypothetical protein
MSSVISDLAKRFAALEAEVKELRAENELLKMAVPLSAVTEALRLGSADEKKAWVSAAQEVINEFAAAPAAAAAAKKPAKEPKAKRATTNADGPKDWNAFVNSVQREMAAAAGVDVDGLSVEELKEAAKKVGAGWQAALKEASIRKRMLEKGEERSVAEAALAAEKSEAKAKKAAKKEGEEKPAPKKAAAAPKPKKSKKAEPSLEEQMAELGMSVREIEGVRYIIDDASGEAFTVNEDGSFGDRVGIYDADAELIDTTA